MVASARVCSALLIFFHVSSATNTTESCVHLYEKGVEAYLENSFEKCIEYFEGSLEKYHDYTRKLQNCRIKCRKEAELSEPVYPVDVDNLLFYEKTVKSTLCIVKCKREYPKIFSKYNINTKVEKLFEKRKPYEYLHICYFQNKEYQKAASTAFTYFVSNPDDKAMLNNLKHYSALDGVNMKEVVNFEAKDYIYLYIYGADAYARKDWKGVVDNMEESLIAYLQSDDECRAQCEGPFDQGWYPDFIPAVANHFTYCLRCKQKCKTQLSSLNGEQHEDLLPSHYHYLQYAYFKQGNLRAACAAVASYLLFYPNDETMLENMQYYSGLPKANDDLFLPRPEAVYYVQREMYEQRLLKFIFKQFHFEEPTKETSEALNYRITMTDRELNGSQRFVADGLANQRECMMLFNLAKTFAVLGDGYHGRMSPHTIMEKFEGVTMKRAALLVHFGLLESKYFDLYMRLTNDAKRKVQEYFRLDELYFTYTHLVCRSALPESPRNRTDFSHPIHADNCNLMNDQICVKSPPAYTWRDYSAIIYLNSGFEGGEFIFAADSNGLNVQSVVKPKCGRMVAFSSGFENLHGVRAVKRGSRCAIGIWFTFDPKHDETDRSTLDSFSTNLPSTS